MSTLQIQPVLAALRKHRIATILIAIEIALACAVLCNACFLIMQRVQAIHVESGVDEDALGTIKLEGFDPHQANDLNARVIQGLRGLSGVQSVTAINAGSSLPVAGDVSDCGLLVKLRSLRVVSYQWSVVSFY